MTQYLGLSALSHDAAAAVVRDDQIVFAAHAERYRSPKNDPRLNWGLMQEAVSHLDGPYDLVFHERPFLKKFRQAWAGDWEGVFDETPREHVHEFMGRQSRRMRYVDHHLSHAAGGYYTSPFREAVIVVIDAIGESATLTVWDAQDTALRKIYQMNYPDSIGLFYTAFTQRCGFKPNEEEYIMMGLAAHGDPEKYRFLIENDFRQSSWSWKFRRDLHRGVMDWHPEIQDVENLAAAVQKITEDMVRDVVMYAFNRTGRRNLVLAGGVALNCVANSALAWADLFDGIWIMPNPGDAGSSLGAALAVRNEWVEWKGPFLGHDIDRPLDVQSVVDELASGQIVGVANGRAEFGPRALGNRSLLSDPRSPSCKKRVNWIKRRQEFRPFAPAVLAEHAREHFNMPVPESPYMQFTARCYDPGATPGVVHVDGTSRVQTVGPHDNPGLRAILEEWHRRTGCPMLLNTSLNVRGKPLVNDWDDALEFSRTYSVPVY